MSVMILPQRKAKIQWQCRRGMLELDLILIRFLQKGLDTLTEPQLVAFETLLTYPDPVLLAWLMGQEKPSDEGLLDLLRVIRAQDTHIRGV